MLAWVTYHHDMNWGWGALSLLGLMLLLALVVGTFASLARPRRNDTARQVLDRRLAEGEITVEEYQRIRDAISGTPADRLSSGAHTPT